MGGGVRGGPSADPAGAGVVYAECMIDLSSLSLPDLYAELARDGHITRLLELARDEDLGPDPERGDVTSRACIGISVRGRARVIIRESGVVSGLACLDELMHLFRVDADAVLRVSDGDVVEAGACVAELSGQMRGVLGVERTLLNLIGRLSGIATRTRRFVERVDGTGAQVCDTRKTTPGLRVLEKYAVRCGGGHPHRLGLYDAVLIKDNHLAAVRNSAAGGASFAEWVRVAVTRARDEAPRTGLRFIELEVDTLDQFRAVVEAGGCGVDMVLMDNMSTTALREAVDLRDRSGLRGQMALEASGGVTLERIGEIAATGVERISVGSLTHGAASLDVGLDAV